MKGFTSFLSGVTSNVQQKLGSHSQASNAAAAHKIVDKDFDKEKENLKTLISEGQDLVKSLKAQARTIRTWLIDPLKDIDAGLLNIYGEDHQSYLAFQKVYVNIQSANFAFGQELDAAIAKMNEYLTAATDLKKVVAQRDSKVSEVDRACVQVFQLQGGRDVSKAQAAMSRYKNLKDEYEKLNAEVLFQLRSFMHQRPERFDAYFKQAMASCDKFFETGASLFAAFGGPEASSHPPLPTPPAHSEQPPLPPKPSVDLLSSDDASSAAPITEPAINPAPSEPPAPEPSTAKSRVEKFGVRMLPVMPARPSESDAPAAAPADTAAAPAAAPASDASNSDAPPPIPPKPARPDQI